MAKTNSIRGHFDEKEFSDALDLLKDMEASIDEKWLKATLRRKAKPIERSMKGNTPSSRLIRMIGITTAKKKTPLIKVGVVKNDKEAFPKFTSYALASVLEYGTQERYRKVKALGFVTGRVSTGAVPKRTYAWLRSSWDGNIKALEEDTIDTIVKRVERAG